MSFLAALNDVAWTAGAPFKGFVVLLLCILAGIGTVWTLPGRRDAAWRIFGGALTFIAAALIAALLIRWTLSAGAAGISYIYFWVFTAVALGGAFRVITRPKPVYSALYFVLTVVASAGLCLLLWAEFVAVALILIYAGAILVTYVFVIMLAAEATTTGETSGASAVLPDHDAHSRSALLSCIAGFAVMGVVLFLIFEKAPPGIAKNDLGGIAPITRADGTTQTLGHTQQLGTFLFRYHFVNIQLAGLLLTIAMIGAIMIARKRIVHAGDEAAEVAIAESPDEMQEQVVLGPAPYIEDDPHAIPVVGTMNPRQKEYPEN